MRLTARLSACSAGALQDLDGSTTMFIAFARRRIDNPALRLRALLAIVVVMGWAVPSLARTQVPTSGTAPESLWTRDTLGGDWGGLRDALGQYGIRFDFWATGFYQDLLQGAGNDEGASAAVPT